MARATKWVKVNLFLSSYFPLWFILLAIQIVSQRNNLFTDKVYLDTFSYLSANIVAFIFVALLSMISFWPLQVVRQYIKETISQNNPDKIMIQSKEDLTSEYLLYIITYVFPFMTAGSFNELGAIALGGALIMIALLYIRGNLFHVNPTLMLIYNYRLYKIVDIKNNTYHILSKQETILSNMRIRANSLNGIFYVEKPFDSSDATEVINP